MCPDGSRGPTGRSSAPPFDADLTDLARRPSSNDDVLQLATEKNCATARSWQELLLAKCTMFREREREWVLGQINIYDRLSQMGCCRWSLDLASIGTVSGLPKQRAIIILRRKY